ncbi:PIH1 domain-containing protein 2 [Latimeria chalumnae]|uniref:PIH1 domain-containing protein 2 n=1 Tax=Latimeria chalumnae TaxID=7897 RepID=H3B7L9_LATCH|nr:PREDICTED: PIH1 domain-containing protein 2 [Latimeria chalumnae]XP_014345497.1 PREDICTED: PIH1 domain-containing protein 2 [Latimeria chalumnae]XP_014345503.1 PREDICTED: PIH1 domain-containing protein 2 [Latimeria chalumnae]|eukprot:XP_005987329.1 PREDICTED: PIH1 domain-containing protein 2 [Latimeria chalumnae]
MEPNGAQKDLLAQVNQLWSILDDMSESSPEEYQEFIQRQLKEGMENCGPPAPHTCIQTRILEPREETLYINICSWNRVPGIQSTSDPVPLTAGKLDEVAEGTDTYTITDIAYNLKVLKRGEEDKVEMDQLIRLAMKYIEEQHKLTLSHSYLITNFKLKGNVKRMKQNLIGRPKSPTGLKAKEKVSGDSLLQQLTNLQAGGKEHENISCPIRLTSDDITQPKKTPLIEEISSTELSCDDHVETPKYELLVLKDKNGQAHNELKVELPEVKSVSECQLSISKNDLLIEVPNKYRLQLDLPVAVHEENISARFSKKSHVLSVRMSSA